LPVRAVGNSKATVSSGLVKVPTFWLARVMSPEVAASLKNMNGKVLVYRGEGAGWRSVKSTCETVERLLSGPLRPLIKSLQVTGSSRDA
jgi:hypothetical protein